MLLIFPTFRKVDDLKSCDGRKRTGAAIAGGIDQTNLIPGVDYQYKRQGMNEYENALRYALHVLALSRNGGFTKEP